VRRKEEDGRGRTALAAHTNRESGRVPPTSLAGLTARSDRLVSELLKWFSAEARDLPWRRTLDPYAIWVSEIMLQQTQVKTVVPYWERWMRRIPSIRELSRAKSETLHKLWEGLGYYGRVRHMQKAARLVMAKHGGVFPSAFEEILALPGVGRYTAGAICSIAFNQPKPILDGNVIRVLTRLFNIRGDPRSPEINSRLWAIAEELVRCASEFRSMPTSSGPASGNGSSPGSCSLFNQALMELGATICTPKKPRCPDCPVANACLARRYGQVEKLPESGRRPAVLRRYFIALVVQNGSCFLARRRPEGVVNGNLWEFPNSEARRALRSKPVSSSQPPALRPPVIAGTLAQLFGAAEKANVDGSVSAPPLRKRYRTTHLCTVKHSITRYRILLEVFHVHTPPSFAVRPADGKWLTLREMSRLPFCSAHKRILERLRDS
jgi:A/G-specific adenine glycosylase